MRGKRARRTSRFDRASRGIRASLCGRIHRGSRRTEGLRTVLSFSGGNAFDSRRFQILRRRMDRAREIRGSFRRKQEENRRALTAQQHRAEMSAEKVGVAAPARDQPWWPHGAMRRRFILGVILAEPRGANSRGADHGRRGLLYAGVMLLEGRASARPKSYRQRIKNRRAEALPPRGRNALTKK